VADDDRTETATGKKRGEAREKGNIARSPEVVTAFLLGAALIGLWMSSEHLFERVAAVCVFIFSQCAQFTVSRGSVMALLWYVFFTVIAALAPLFLATIIGAMAGNILQVGFMFTTEPLTPDLGRLNPINGLKNLFKPENILEFVKGLIKVTVLTWVAYATIKGDLDNLPFLSDAPLQTFMVYQLDMGFRIIKNVLIIYALIAAADYALKRYEYEKGIKMTKQEVKDEWKQTEGDPQIKRRIRSLQVEMARRRMMAEVPKADVVITNPTHFAVALKFDPAEMEAPQVLAKGADRVAHRIIELAEENHITIYRAPEVARALFRQTEPGDTIPADMFQAVAEILAHVYRLTGKAR
jgi:flagellar biosynthetic protein FlhB